MPGRSLLLIIMVGLNPCSTDWVCIVSARGQTIGPKYVHCSNQLLDVSHNRIQETSNEVAGLELLVMSTVVVDLSDSEFRGLYEVIFS